jgi:S-formylglutathione hydrolase FrmB
MFQGSADAPGWRLPGRIANVELLWLKGNLQGSEDETGLKVAMPAERPCEHAIALKIALA